MTDYAVTGFIDGVAAAEVVSRLVSEALASYPNANGDPVVALALMVSSQRHAFRERDEVLSLNAWQAQRIAELERR